MKLKRRGIVNNSITAKCLYAFAALILALGALPLADFLLSSNNSTAYAESSPYLRWKPPVLEDPITLTPSTPNSFFPGELEDGQDYIINLNSISDGEKVKRTRAIQIRGGRNIVIIGGHTTLGNSAAETAAISITRGNNTSTEKRIVHIEGVLIEGGVLNADGETPIYHDGIVVSDPYVDLRVQNCRIVGIRGKLNDIHADIIQAQSTDIPGARAAAAIRVDKLTGTTNYQGMYLVPDDERGAGPALIDMHRVNLSYWGPPEEGFVTYMTYFGDSNGEGLDYAPGFIDEYYIDNNRPGQTVEKDSVWPSILGPTGFEASVIGNKITWPHLPLLKGSVTIGQPEDGDFVPEGVAGMDYVSPGYREDHLNPGGIVISELTPSDNSEEVDPETDRLEIAFDNYRDHISKGTGKITIFTASDTVHEEIDVTDDDIVSIIDSSKVSIQLQNELSEATNYYVQIDPTAFYDGILDDIEYFAGIDDKTTWNFRTSGEEPNDNDGVDNGIEDGAPNDGDGNNDGIKDSLQAGVASFVNAVTGEYVTIEVSCDLNEAKSITIDENIDDDGFVYDLGLIDFTATCASPGAVASVTQYYYNPPEDKEFVFRKLAGGTFFTIDDAEIGFEEVNGQNVLKVSYMIEDGGELDDDGDANGVIVDPAGPAILADDGSSEQAPGVPNTGIFKQANNLLQIVSCIGLVMIVGAITIVRMKSV